MADSEAKIRNYIACITAGKFLQDYITNEKEYKKKAIDIAREKKYISDTSEDLSRIPPFMFYQIIEESIKIVKADKAKAAL
jgi:hypothetical protein